MPDPGSIEVGKAHVEVSADNSKLDTKVQQAKAKTEELGDAAQDAGQQAATGMGAAEVATERVAESTETAASGFRRLGDVATKVQGVVSKIAIPFAVISALGSIGRLLGNANREAEALQKKLHDISDAAATAAQREETALRSVTDISQKRKSILIELKQKQDEIAKSREDEIEKENHLFGIRSEIIGASTNRLLRELGLRRSLNDELKEHVDAAADLNEATQRRLDLLREEQERREKLAADAARDFEKQTRMLEAQAEGQTAALREQIRQLADEYGEAISRAEDDAQADALKRRFWALRRILQQQLQDIETANAAQIAADQKAADERRQREEEEHRKRLQEIEERKQKEIKALEDIFRKQEEGFDRINQELVTGLKGIATAVQQASRRGNDNPIVLGGGA